MMINRLPTLTLFALCILVSLPSGMNAQDASDCKTKYGCLKYPSTCTGTDCLFLIKWLPTSSANTTTATTVTFYMYVQMIQTSIAQAWLGIAFSTDQKMGADNAYICRRTVSYTTNTIQSYFNNPLPTMIGDGNVGITNTYVSTSNKFLICAFTRANSNTSVETIFDIASNNFYMLVAYGPITNNVVALHKDKIISDKLIDFTSMNSYTASRSNSSVKAHGSLMVIAWLWLAATGMIISRYYKNLLSSREVMGKKMWILIHRPIMVTATAITLTAFIVVLSSLHWTWSVAGNNWTDTEFTHSVIGMFVVGLSIVQVFVAMFRCDKDSEHRYIFNKFHRLNGMSTFVFAVISIYLGTTLTRMNLADYGWGIVLGWTLWMVIVLSILEICKFLYDDSLPHEVTAEKEDLVETIKEPSLSESKNSHRRAPTNMNKEADYFEPQPGQKKDDPDRPKIALPKSTTAAEIVRSSKTITTTKNLNPQIDKIKKILIIVHVVITGGFTIALLALIAVST